MASTPDTRTFNTGATRNNDENRIDPEGFFSPEVLEEFCAYMHKCRFRPSGEIRNSDNWQLGIPQSAYAKSLWRHHLAFMKQHRKQGNHKEAPSPYRNNVLIEQCCAGMFNYMGYMFEELKKPLREDVMEIGPLPDIKMTLKNSLPKLHSIDCDCSNCVPLESDNQWGI